MYDSLVYDSLVYDSLVYDSLVYDSLVYDSLVYDSRKYVEIPLTSRIGLSEWGHEGEKTLDCTVGGFG